MEGSISKYFATEVGDGAANDAIQGLGGYGYIREFEVEKIKAQINVLSDFLASKLREDDNHKPKTKGMIDPRTGKPFRDGNGQS